MSRYVSLVFLVACGSPALDSTNRDAPTTALPDGYSLTGDLPGDVDLDAVVQRLQPGSFAVFGTPDSSNVAVLSRHDDATSRDGVGGAACFTGAVATCLDCGDATCATSERTIAIELTHESGPLERHQTQTFGDDNFNSPSVYTWTPDAIGDTEVVQVTGTLPACSTFSYFFNMVLSPELVAEQPAFLAVPVPDASVSGRSASPSFNLQFSLGGATTPASSPTTTINNGTAP